MEASQKRKEIATIEPEILNGWHKVAKPATTSLKIKIVFKENPKNEEK